MKNRLQKYGAFIVGSTSWLAIDLITKYWILAVGLKPLVFIQNFFYLTFHTNKGVAFGILLGHYLQIVVSIFILSFLIYFGFTTLFQSKRFPLLNQALLGIIVGGAIGNLVNRIHLGYVIDFIALKPFPIFNLADVGITLGLIILFIVNYKK